MTDVFYFRFNNPQLGDKKEEIKTSNIENFIVKMLNSIIPVGNPDYDEQLEKVHKWLVEYDKEENTVKREIGLGENGEVLLILPLNENLGYWSNSKLELESYQSFEPIEISKGNFEEKWNAIPS